MQLKIIQAQQAALHNLLIDVTEQDAALLNDGETFLSADDFIGNISRKIMDAIISENASGTIRFEEVH